MISEATQMFFPPRAGRRVLSAPVCVSQSVLQHPAVGDCAVVGLEDSLKGVVPLALCVLKNGEA